MGLIFKIAWRNVLRHKGKSAVIGTILFIGAFLMTLGNGIVGGMERGLEKNIVNGFTGHVVLVAEEQQSDDVFDVFIEFMGKAVEPIADYAKVHDALAGLDYVKRYLPVGKNSAMVINDEGGMPGFAFLLGVEIDKYRDMFPDNIEVIEGRPMEPGEAAVMMPTGARKEYFGTTGLWFKPRGTQPDTAHMVPDAKRLWPDELTVKENIVFMGMNDDNTTTDIRVPVRGIFKYRALNRVWGNFTLIDIESFRCSMGYFAHDMSATISDAQRRLLEMDTESLDALFGTDADEVTVQKVQAPPPPADVGDPLEVDAGVYNLVLVLLRDGMSPKEGAVALNRDLKESGVPLRAIPWRKAAGMIGSMTRIIRGSLLVFVFMLFVVAIIIIINTLSMTALERVPEIGMMRAVGARKGFISLMFLGETATLSFVFGGLGMLAGLAVVNIVPFFNITSTNEMVKLLFGGDTLHPSLAPRDLILMTILLAFVTVLAVIYPLFIARRITPLDAVTRE